MSSAFIAPDESLVKYYVDLRNALDVTFVVLTCTVVLLRVWVRTKLIKCWGMDDWTILVALILFLAQCSTQFYLAHVERKTGAMGFKYLEQLSEIILVEESLELLSLIFLKLSLALFFTRFIVDRWARMVVWISMTIYMMWTFSLFFVLIFECGIPKNVLLKATEGQCLPPDSLFNLAVVWGAFNALTDWLFAMLPIFFMLRSRMTTTTKVSAVSIMVLAILGSIASIVRIIYIKELSSAKAWEVTTLFLVWSIVEPGLGIIAACLATLRPLLQLFAERTKQVLSTKATSDESGSEGTNGTTKFELANVGASGGKDSVHFTRSTSVQDSEVGLPQESAQGLEFPCSGNTKW